MLLKRALFFWRNWIIFLGQVIGTVLCFLMPMVNNPSETSYNMPPLSLDLSQMGKTITLVDNGAGSSYAQRYFHALGGLTSQVSYDIDTSIATEFKSNPFRADTKYLVGAAFMTEKSKNIKAWFNNNPLHTPPMSLGLVLNAIFKQVLQCRTCSIEYINHPLPRRAQSMMTFAKSGGIGHSLASSIAFYMSFITSCYILFVVKENSTKFKHLQYVAGTKVLIFWLAMALWDTFTFIILILVAVLFIVPFQMDGFRTCTDIGHLFVLMFAFGWAVLPITYVAAYFFNITSSGYVTMANAGLLTALIPLFVTEILDKLDFKNVSMILNSVCLIFPHYCLVSAIKEYFQMFTEYSLCQDMLSKANLKLHFLEICGDVDGDYFILDTPGIGKHIICFGVEGLVFYLILLVVDSKLPASIYYYLLRSARCLNLRQWPIQAEEEDVAAERERIRTTTTSQLREYAVVLRDLSKHFKTYWAVKSLCLGIQSSECFGLIGMNGAGKTTTFKMMTGDLSISYGDCYIMGHSVKHELKQVYQCIGYCPQFHSLLDELTPEETIRIVAMVKGVAPKECDTLVKTLAREFDFTAHVNKKVKTLSGGNKRKLSSAVTVVGDPDVIFLDEPTTGMDPIARRCLLNVLCKVRDSGKSLILTSHNMEECEALCTRLAIMVHGSFMCLGSPQHLKNKFADSYTLTVKLKRGEDDSYNSGPIQNYVKDKFPEAVLKERHDNLLSYNLKTEAKWSQMFGIMERAKRGNYNIEDYALGQSNLEQCTIPPPVALGPVPVRLVCPYCHSLVWTVVVSRPTLQTHLFAALCCLVCFPCVLLPYCTPMCQAKDHFCPICQAFIGSFD